MEPVSRLLFLHIYVITVFYGTQTNEKKIRIIQNENNTYLTFYNNNNSREKKILIHFRTISVPISRRTQY